MKEESEKACGLFSWYLSAPTHGICVYVCVCLIYLF